MSSLAKALAASKKGGSVPEKKKAEPPRPSSLMQYQQTKGKEGEHKEKGAVTKTTQQQKMQGKQQHIKKNHDNKGNINHHKPNQKKTENKSGNMSNEKSGSKSPNRKGKKKRGAQSTSQNNCNNADDEAIVFVCDIPSDSDDSDYIDECDGVDGDGDFEDDDYVDDDGGNGIDHADLEEGECDSDSDSDIDVVVIMDGLDINNTQNASQGGREMRGKGDRGGGRGGRGNRNEQGNNKAGGRGRDKVEQPKHQNNAREKDRRGNADNYEKDRRGGRDFRSGNINKRGEGASAKPTQPTTSSGLMPTPWSTRGHAVKNQTDNRNQNQHSSRKQHSRNDNRAHGGRHSGDSFPARDNRQHRDNHRQNPPSTSTPKPSFAPASTLTKPDKLDVPAAPVKFESAAIKGRWADEDSDDE